VREKTPQQLSSALSLTVGAFYFSQKNTDEQNTQHSTETLSQPITQNVTANFSSNALWTLYAEGVLWARNVRQKAQWTLCALWEKKPPKQVSSALSLTVGAFYFSQKDTEEQNTQHPTETLSQPITQNLTATFSSNALWTLYAEGVLWARNVRLNAPWTLCALWEKNLPSVRGKTPQRLAGILSYREGTFSFSQIYTEEKNTQNPTETLSQPITQNVTANISCNVLWYLYAEGLLWVRNSAQRGSVKSVSSVRDKPPKRER